MNIRKIIIVVLCILSAAFYTACDYVANAVPTTPATATTPVSGVVARNILIEDYTGHQCGNCPAAARELHRLDSIYAGRIIPVAVHAGYYATVTSATAVPSYTTNFNTTAGTDYDNFFGNSAAGNPNGLVNRFGYNTGGFIEQWSTWATTVGSYLPDTSMFDIAVTNTYNSSSNQLTADVKCTAMQSLTGSYRLVVLLTEDSIIASNTWQ